MYLDPSHFAHMRILLIEDDTKLAVSLAKSLRAEGFMVDEARDGIAGEELARVNAALDQLIQTKSVIDRVAASKGWPGGSSI